MGRKVEISRTELFPKQLRRFARSTKSLQQMRRLNAIADVLDGVSRGRAATRNGMDPRTMFDWIYRYNDEGPEGLKDRPRNGLGPKPRLDSKQLERLVEKVRAGPDKEVDGLVRWRR